MATRVRRHDSARVLVDLAITLADGGEGISDLSVLRQQPELFGEVASTPTAWRVLDSIVERMLARMTAAVARARGTVWEWGLGQQRVTLDFDATLVEVESEGKEQAAPNYKHGFGYHPLLVYLDQAGEALGGAPLDPATPAPIPPRIMSVCWTRRSLSYLLPPDKRTKSEALRCWLGRTRQEPATVS
jgi:hypothetical protein